MNVRRGGGRFDDFEVESDWRGRRGGLNVSIFFQGSLLSKKKLVNAYLRLFQCLHYS